MSRLRHGGRLVDDVVVLADVAKDPLSLGILLFPLLDIVIRCLLLQSSQKCLIFECNLDEFLPPLVPVETPLVAPPSYLGAI